MRRTTLCAALACAATLAATASPALAVDNGGTATGAGGTTTQFDPGQLTGGTPNTPDVLPTPSQPAPQTAHTAVLSHGAAFAPADAPLAVRVAIQAANHIRHKPYVWGGGHGSFTARGYDCSGAVSYVLHAAGLLSFPEVSGALAHWGAHGDGEWITVYANSGHAFMVIAGLRFDTSGSGGSGPRWRTDQRWMRGFHRRHPAGL